jgi:hypothetical protein
MEMCELKIFESHYDLAMEILVPDQKRAGP